MKNHTLLVIFTILVAASARLHAGTVSSSISSESLVTAPPVEAVSVGLNYDQGKRKVRDNATDIGTLESRAYSVLLGYDVVNWCTLFATLGRSEARLSERNGFGDGKVKWSIGLNANLWHVNIDEPPLFAGRISIKPSLEYSQNNSTIDNKTVKWTDVTGALFLNYEKTIDDPKYNLTEFYGYTVYAGPAFSVIDGKTGNGSSFKESTNVGVIGGLDIFIRKNVSLGAQVQSFDEMSFSGNFRYHF